METVTDFIFLGSKITADGDCSHEIKRCLLFGRETMTNLDSILKRRDIVLCLMSESLSGKREGLQDNATRKKGSLLLTRVRAPATSKAVVWGQRAPSPSCYTNL